MHLPEDDYPIPSDALDCNDNQLKSLILMATQLGYEDDVDAMSWVLAQRKISNTEKVTQ